MKTAPSESPTPTLSPACLGRVVYPVDGSGDGGVPGSLCVTVGTILRVENVGAGSVSAEPGDLVSRREDAGTVDCRFVGPGTVTVTITHEDQTTDSISVLVVSGEGVGGGS